MAAEENEEDMPIIVEDDFTTIVSSQTTGGHVWEAARVLFDYISRNAEVLPEGGAILELGSGTGWLGMALACRFSQLRRVMLTEMLEGNAFEWLQHNVESNRKRGLLLGAVESVPCDWGWFQNAPDGTTSSGATPNDGLAAVMQTERWELVLGSDLVYNEAGVRMLPRVLRSLVRENTKVPILHCKGP